MQAKKKNQDQLSFYSTFEEQLNHQHPLFQLGNEIRWQIFEESFSKHYHSTTGRPAKEIRLMVGLLILKYLRNLSDESVVEQWSENSYYQYFCGEKSFCSGAPCTFSELHHFRERIGEEGVALILQESIRVNGKDGDDDNVSLDTTVHEKNITFPTDDKLYKKIIRKCQGIAQDQNIELRQSYVQTIKKLSIQQRFRKSKKGWKNARKADRKIKTIAGRLVREIERKLSTKELAHYGNDLQLFKRVLAQKRGDSHKIYSLHEPHVKCMSKGKDHKKYEFGTKASIAVTQRTGVIVGAFSFEENIYDGHTIEPALEQIKKLTGKFPRNIYADRGYKGRKKIGETEIHFPITDKTKTLTQRKRHKRRAAIEPKIGHLKFDHRLGRNFLKGVAGDAINLMMAASAMNFKRIMNIWKRDKTLFVEFFQFIFSLLFKQNAQENIICI